MKKEKKFKKMQKSKSEFNENVSQILSEAAEIGKVFTALGIDPERIHAVCVTPAENGVNKAFDIDFSANPSFNPRELSEEELDLLTGKADIDGEDIDRAYCESCNCCREQFSDEPKEMYKLTLGEVALLKNLYKQ